MRTIKNALQIIFVFLLQAFLGCTPSGTNNSSLLLPKAIEIDALTPIQDLLHGHSVVCPSGTLCPDGIGQVLTKFHEDGKTMMSVCTGFLISPDTILTNSHCIPEEIINRPALCPEQLGIKFPASSKLKEESLSCRKILLASEVLTSGPMAFQQSDYAVIQLETTTARTPLRLSRSGIEDKTYYRAITVDPVATSTLAGEINVKSCLAIRESQVFRSFQYFLDSVVSLFGENDECRIIHGNSGSPVVDETGAVRGLIQAGSVDPFESFLAQMARLGAWKSQRNLTLALASNLACLNLRSEAPAQPLPLSICRDEKALKEAREKFVKATDQRNDENLQRQVLKRLETWWKPSGDVVYRLHPGPIASEETRMTLPYQVQPICRRPESQLTNLENLTVTAPILQLRTQLDAFLRLEVVVTDVLPDNQQIPLTNLRSLPICQSAELSWGSNLSKVIGSPQQSDRPAKAP